MTTNQTPKAETVTAELEARQAKRDAKVTTRRCNCGCGEATSSSKTQYKPGHDARHAGQVARAMAAAKINGDTTYSPALETLGSDKLRSKAQAMAKRIVEQVSEKAAKAARRPATRKAAGDKADKKATAALVAQEEAAHAAAEAAKRAEIEAELDEDGQLTEREAPEGQGLIEELPEQLKLSEAQDGTVRVGRWSYPARKWVTGLVEKNTKRDGSGEWEATNRPFTAS